MLKLFFLVLMMSYVPIASAATSFNSLGLQFAGDNGHYLTIFGSQTIRQKQFHFQLGSEMSSRTLVLLNPVGARIRDVIGKQFSLQFSGVVGLHDAWNIGLHVGFIPYQEFSAIDTGLQDNGFRMGDFTVTSKIRLLDREKSPIGLALIPFVIIPTGNDSHFTGEGHVIGGAHLAIESPRFDDWLSMAVNVGYQGRKEVALSPGTSIDDQFHYGVGVNVAPLSPLELIAEIKGWTILEDFFSSDYRPLTIHGGVRTFFVERKFSLTVGAGTAVISGIGSPSWQVSLALNYTLQPKPPYQAEEVEIRPKKVDIQHKVEIDQKGEGVWYKKIYFGFDMETIPPESYSILDEIASFLRAHPKIVRVAIVAHTDSIGSDFYNLELSRNRADGCLQYLVNQGLPMSRLISVPRGETEPVATNESKEGRAQNRRAEFYLVGAHDRAHQ